MESEANASSSRMTFNWRCKIFELNEKKSQIYCRTKNANKTKVRTAIFEFINPTSTEQNVLKGSNIRSS